MKSTDDALSFLEHLEELRERIIKSLIALVLGTVVGYFLADKPLDLLLMPISRAQNAVIERSTKSNLKLEIAEDGTVKVLNRELILEEGFSESRVSVSFFSSDNSEEPIATLFSQSPNSVVYLRPTDPFVIYLKASILLGIIFSLPIILYQIWAFISPGLLPREKKLALPLIVSGTLLFPFGAAFAYFLLEVTLRFFSEFVMEQAMVQNDARAYLGFALTMMLAFGIVFEFPLVVILATRVGIVKVDWLANRRGYIFVAQLILAAIITPTGDPVTLLAMALPLQVLFEISLVVSRVLDKIAKAEDDEESEESEDQETDMQ